MPTPRGGTASYYRPETVAIVRRIRELRRQTRSADDWLWRLWIEGYPVEILPWAKRRLEASAKKIEDVRRDVSRKDLAQHVAKRRTFDGRTISPKQEVGLLDAALSAGAGKADGFQPSAFGTLLKVAGLSPQRFPHPEVELVEMLAVERQSELVASATEDEAEQARRDWQAIARLVETAEAVDWAASMPAIEPAIARITGEQSDPPSWRARKANRARPQGAPATIGLLLDQWRDYDGRAMMLAFLIGARRDRNRSKRITELIALADWALSLFPRKEQASNA